MIINILFYRYAASRWRNKIKMKHLQLKLNAAFPLFDFLCLKREFSDRLQSLLLFTLLTLAGQMFVVCHRQKLVIFDPFNFSS